MQPPPPPQNPQQPYPPQGFPPQQQYPPQQQGYPPQGYGAPPPPQKKSSVWLWVIGAVLGLMLIAAAGVAITGYFFFQKAKQITGFDQAGFKKNPALALSRMAVAMNPDYEVQGVDDGSGVVTVREKSTGKVVQFKFDEEKKQLMIVGDDGKKVRIGGTEGEGVKVDSPEGSVQIGGNAKAPAWVPIASGAKVQSTMTVSEGSGKKWMLTFTSNDAGAKVMEQLKDAAQKNGLTVSNSSDSPMGSVLEVEDASKNRKVVYTILSTGGSGSTVTIVATEG
jgi:hypothetical protein